MIMDRSKNKEQFFKGCLIGGAIGDALGYAVEFTSYAGIVESYGEQGIQRYQLSKNGKALISDDTQMTLFTANGLLVGSTRGKMRGAMGAPSGYVYLAYLDWLTTQGMKKPREAEKISWIKDVPELNDLRAPGNTCLSALMSDQERSLDYPLNHSKGCGAVMRIAPFGLFYGDRKTRSFLEEAMEIGALTHGHPMSHLSCAMMAYIIGQIIYKDHESIKDVVKKSLLVIDKAFKAPIKKEFIELMERAVALTENAEKDVDNIAKLGEGWIAEEALAIAVYCACKYQEMPINGIIAAVNHSGDSDSTGAIAGNILGAWNGYDAFPKEWIDDLEIHEVIEEIATDLATGCPMSEHSDVYDEQWDNKYVKMKCPVKYN